MKIYCIEVRKEGFDDIPFGEVKKMVGWIEPGRDNETWDVTMADGCGFECNNQRMAQVLASIEEVKAMLIQNEEENGNKIK